MDLSYIYEARKTKAPLPRKKPPFYIWGIIGGAIIIISGIVTYFAFQAESTLNIAPENPEKDCEKILNRSQDGELIISVCVRKDGSLVLLWQNLPDSFESIKIYRKGPGGDSAELWQEVKIFSPNGSAELGSDETAKDFSYSFSAENADGDAIWNSNLPGVRNTGPINGPAAQAASPAASTSSSSINPPTATPPPTSAPPTGTPTSSTPGTTSSSSTNPPSNPPTSSSTEDENQIIYYTPEGGVSGTSTFQSANFWVIHVNKKIEVGWQNLPVGTDKIVVFRSAMETSGYEILLTQANPKIAGDFIRLDDHTLNKSFYYKMSAYNGSSPTNTYGPVFLGPL